MRILVTKEELMGILRLIADRSFALTCGMIFALLSMHYARISGA